MNRRLILGIIWCVIALALSGLFIKGITSYTTDAGEFWKEVGSFSLLGNKNDYMRNGMKSFSSKEEVFDESVKEIEVDVKSESIEAIKSDEKKIRIEFVDEAEKYTEAKISGNKLSVIQTTRIPGFFFVLRTPKVIIHIPAEKYDKINLQASSGTIKADGLKTDNLTIKASSGTIKVEDTVAEKAEISVSSGTINADEVSIGSINVTSSSGTVKLQGKILQADVKCTSGTIKVENEVKFEKDSSFTASSGTITLELTPSNEYFFETNATSGSIKNEMDSNRFGNVAIKAKTTSGSIRIRKN